MAMFCTIGFQNAFGVFQEYYAKTLLADESVSTIGWLGTIAIFLIFLGAIFTGVILDLFGPVVSQILHLNFTCLERVNADYQCRSCSGSALSPWSSR
jgi:MFS family permease